MSDESPLKAFWPDGRRVQPGRDAQAFLDQAAVRFGEKPAYIRQSITRDTPAGRMILALLGLTREAVHPSRRPTDTPRTRLILSVVDALRDAGNSEAEAFALAPKYLLDPKLREQHRIGRGEGALKSQTGKAITSKHVRAAYRKALEGGFNAKLWFVEPVEADASAVLPADRKPDFGQP